MRRETGEKGNLPIRGYYAQVVIEPTAGRACWWCGAPANSGEHKFKRSDLVRAFGGGEWGSVNQVAHVEEGDIGYPRSSRADRLKFRSVLCRDCNSQRSQPFDSAYDIFAEWLRRSERNVVATGEIDWSEVFGESWRIDLGRLTGYWVKHIGCRLAADGVPVPAALSGYLDGRGPLAHLEMALEIRSDIAAAMFHLEDVHGIEGSSLWIGPAQQEVSGSGGHIVRVWSHWGFGSLRLAYVCDFEEAQGVSNFDAQVVRLNRDYNVDPSKLVAECAECKIQDE